MTLIIIYFDNEELRANFIVALIGLVVVALIFMGFYNLKKNFDDYAKTAIPALIVFCWIFLYLPFSGIIPVSLMYLSVDDEKLVSYERMVFAVVFLLLLAGLILLTIVIHLFFKRRDFEKKFKFIASKVIK